MRINQTHRLIKAARDLGLNTDYVIASTGSVYLQVEKEMEDGTLESKTIRISNHSDAYGRADYTCDGVEGTVNGAIDFLERFAGRSLRKARNLKRKRFYWEEFLRGYRQMQGMLKSNSIASLETWLNEMKRSGNGSAAWRRGLEKRLNDYFLWKGEQVGAPSPHKTPEEKGGSE